MKFKTTVKEIVQETPRVRLIRLEADEVSKLNFRPGQWIGTWCDEFVGENNKPIRRAFSIASKQNESYLELCVARGKEFSAHLQDLKEGAVVNIDGPFGNFWLRPGKSRLFIAGGTGIAPFRPMIHQALEEGSKVVLLYSMKTPADFIYRKELEECSANLAFTLVPTITSGQDLSNWTGQRGRVQALLPKVWKPGVDVYVCGPPAMVEDVEKKLVAMGQPKDRIFVDKWE